MEPRPPAPREDALTTILRGGGVRDTGGRGLIHWEVALLSLSLGIYELGDRLPCSKAVQWPVWFLLLTCGGTESVAWHLKSVRCNLFTPNKLGPNANSRHPTPAHICMHHQIQLAVGYISFRHWKPSLSLTPPPRPTFHGQVFFAGSYTFFYLDSFFIVVVIAVVYNGLGTCSYVGWNLGPF